MKVVAEVQWGNAAEWATVAAAVAGFIITYFLLRDQVFAARRVAAWVDVDRTTSETAWGDVLTTYHWRLNVRNGDSTPVYFCTVTVGDPVPGSSSAGASMYVGTVPPEHTLTRHLAWTDGPPPDSLLAPALVVTLTFDSRGRHWRVDAAGNLHRAKAPQSTC